MIRSVSIGLLSTLVFVSCEVPIQQGEVVAEAYGNKLYMEELAELITDKTSVEDSVFITKEYINIWLAQQVLLHKAELLLSDKEKDKTKQLADYKTDLLTYEVLNKLALQELDTTFDEEELEEYYEDNKDEFELSQNIIKIKFYKIPQSAEDIDLLWSSFRNGDKSLNGKLKKLSEQGGNYYLNDSTWVFFDDILKEIPINTYNQEHYLNNNKYIKVNDGNYIYFIKISDFKIRSSTSPFSIERENIKQILLMKRQQDLIKKIETNLVKDAYSKQEIRTF